MPCGLHSKCLQWLLLAGPILLFAASADAQVRYVSVKGNNNSPCTSAALPCRTLQRGIDAAPVGGEVRVLDSGNFGNPTINKSLTISANEAATIFGQITVNAAGAAVVFRDLQLNGGGVSDIGIDVIAVSALHVEHCEIERVNGHGIYFVAPGGSLFVEGTISRDNAHAGLVFYDATASPSDFGTMTLTIDDSNFENNGDDGLLLDGGTITISRTTIAGNHANGIASGYSALTITETTASQNRGTGFLLQRVRATIDSSIAQGNDAGLFAGGNDPAIHTVTISNSVFVNNISTGVGSSGGVLMRTRGNNTIVDNPTDVLGTLTPLSGT